MPSEAIGEKDLENYLASWNALTLGLVKEADPTDWKLKTKELKVGKYGDIKLGEIIIGMEGSIKTVLEQVKVATIRQLCPWWSSGTVPMTPAIRHKDLYDYAQQLILKPVGEATTDNDITLLKVFPKFSHAKGDGNEFREITVEWVPFPDRAALATNKYATYGYFGPPPA